MKILVTEMPEKPSECLFAQHNCSYGWFCSLFSPKRGEYNTEQFYCNVKTCPYLQYYC